MTPRTIATLTLTILCTFLFTEDNRIEGKGISVCYLRSWTRYKKGKAKFFPKDVDVNLCSVVSFASKKVNVNTHLLDGRPDNKDDPMIQELIDLKKKKPSLKVFISIGGWSHEELPRFANMVRTKARRAKFITSVIKYLKSHKLDGVGIDWEYPAHRAGATPEDKTRFVWLLKDMRRAFKDIYEKEKKKFFLTLAVSASRAKIDKAYDIPRIARYVDWVDVMAYNLRSHRQEKTGCPTLMYGKVPTVVDSLDAWLDGGMPASKINLGLASYGRSYELANSLEHGLGAPILGKGAPYNYTLKEGVLSYYEICEINWTSKTTWQNSACGTPYSSGNVDGILGPKDLWVAYESPSSIRHKVDALVNTEGLNGISFWALDFDDFTGTNCNQGRYPLLSAAVDEMNKV